MAWFEECAPWRTPPPMPRLDETYFALGSKSYFYDEHPLFVQIDIETTADVDPARWVDLD